MSAPRLHVDASRWPQGQTLRIEGDRAHYLRNVLRLREGAEVRPFNADDGEWLGAHRGLRPASGAISLVEQRAARAVPEPGPTLVFAPIRRNRLDWLVEKAVELGVGPARPGADPRAPWSGPRGSERLAAIAIEAAEQCERLTVPR